MVIMAYTWKQKHGTKNLKSTRFMAYIDYWTSSSRAPSILAAPGLSGSSGSTGLPVIVNPRLIKAKPKSV